MNDGRGNLNSILSNIESLPSNANPLQIGTQALEFAKILSQVIDNSVIAAYEIGLSDPESIPAKAGLIDLHLVENAIGSFKKTSEEIVDPKLKQAEILKLAGILAKNTAFFCTNSRSLADNQKIGQAERSQLSSLANDLTASAGILANSIKALTSQQNDQNRKTFENASNELLNHANNFLDIISIPEISGERAIIGQAGLQAQEPLFDKTYLMIDTAEKLINSMKDLCVDTKDLRASKTSKALVRSLHENTNNLVVAISENIPGFKEFEQTIQKVKLNVPQLEKAFADYSAGKLSSPDEDSIFAIEALNSSLRVLSSLVELTKESAIEGSATFKASINEIPSCLATVRKLLYSIDFY